MKKFRIEINNKWCKSCNLCVNFCPAKNLELTENGLVFFDRCTGCGLCEKYCPDSAIEVLECS